MQYTNGNPVKIQRNTTIAHDRLSGATYRELSEKHGIDKGQISRILNDTEIKDVIETGTKHLVSMVPKAIDNYQIMLNDTKSLHHYKASKDCLTATGILPSHTSNTTINNILNVNSGPTEAQIERIQELLEQRQAIDITPDSVSSSDD